MRYFEPEPRQQGRDAALAGKTIADCPYSSDREARLKWIAAWRNTRHRLRRGETHEDLKYNDSI